MSELGSAAIAAGDPIAISWPPCVPAPGPISKIHWAARIIVSALLLLQPYVDTVYGLHLPIDPPNRAELATLGAIAVAGCLAGLLPALRAYRLSLADGMTVRT